MGFYTKKPITVEAVQFTGENWTEVFSFVNSPDAWHTSDGKLVIGTLEGDMVASPGDWIIRGAQGEFYPCKPDIFAATYDVAEAD